MKVKNIKFPTGWEDNPSIDKQKIDVLVELENNYTYVLVVATTEHIKYLMDQNQKGYFEPGMPVILVKELTKKIIEETVKAYVEEDDEYWLKSGHFAGEIDTIVFDKLQAEHIEKTKEIFGVTESEPLDESYDL